MEIDRVKRILADHKWPSFDRHTVAGLVNALEMAWESNRKHAGKIELLEAALEPLAEYATERVADAPEWDDNDTVSIVVSIGDLRRVRDVIA